MPPTLASLVHHSALKLTVRAGEDRLDVPVRWAHVSELADPVPYMEGGELLLITALKLDAENPEAMRRYVRRLVGAGVVGLGFAVGVNYEEIPKALVDAAAAGGSAAAGGAAPYALPRHQQSRVGGHRGGPVPVGDGRFRGATGADQAGVDRRPGRAADRAGLAGGTAGRRCTTRPAAWSRPRRSGRGGGRPGSRRTWERLRERPAPASSVVGGPENEDRVELHTLGTGRAGPRRTGRGDGGGARYGGAVRRPLGDRAADPDHRAVEVVAGGRTAGGGGGAAHAARRGAGSCAGGGRAASTEGSWTRRSG